jgi:hypothetical protein
VFLWTFSADFSKQLLTFQLDCTNINYLRIVTLIETGKIFLMKKPNFFIAGAPRCGTTALYKYLSEHPQIFMSEVKELNYFAFDYPNVQKIHCSSIDAYQKLFSKANNRHLAVGEASPFYLFSSMAFQNIYAFNPDAKIILTLRNPIDFVHSFHQLNLSLLREDVEDLEKAWDLQPVRAKGERVPLSCREPELIAYGELGKFGKYVKHLYDVFPREQVKIIVLEELAATPGKIYEEVLNFIQVPSDGRVDFLPVNTNFQNRSQLMAKFFHPPQPIYDRFMKSISLFGPDFMKSVTLFYNKVEGLNVTHIKRKPMSPEFQRRLSAYFHEDILQLQDIIGRDLSLWLDPIGQNPSES